MTSLQNELFDRALQRYLEHQRKRVRLDSARLKKLQAKRGTITIRRPRDFDQAVKVSKV